MKTACFAFILLTLVLGGSDHAVAGPPSPDIKAWGSDDFVRVAPSAPVSLTVALDAGSDAGQEADWWVVAITPFGELHMDVTGGELSWAPGIEPTYQGPLFTLPSVEILRLTGLPEGVYTFYFGVDLRMNGVPDLDRLYLDFVRVEVYDSEIFIKAPQPHLVHDIPYTHGGGSTSTRKLPVDQMLLMWEEDLSPATARSRMDAILAEHRDTGLRLVGQIPDLGIYQLEIDNPAADIGRLDAVMAEMRTYPGVATVCYNEPLNLTILENDDDNSALLRRSRCALSVIDYYQAIPVFDALRSSLRFHPVGVAVIDSGLWLGSGQFDDIRPRLVNLSNPGVEPMDASLSRNHGTLMASIIAADNHDGRINGIALRVLGDNLTLMVGYGAFGAVWHASVLARAREAVAQGARVVNMSLGANAHGATPPWLRNLQNQYMRLFKLSPQTLFVASAPNEPFRLDNNDAPSGLPNSNLITVGGVESCDFTSRAPHSAWGPDIDIAAPSTDVPLCCLGDDLTGPIDTIESGNSVAAAIVTSISAILSSLDPSLSGAGLKAFLTDANHTWPAPADLGEGRPALIRTAGSLILDIMSSPSVDRVMDAFAGLPDDLPDPSGHMANRLCGDIEFSVAGPEYERSHHLTGSDIAFNPAALNFGIIGNGYSVFNFHQGMETVTGSAGSGFRLDRDYAFYDGGPNSLLISAGAPGGDFMGTEARSGSFRYTECEMTTRSLPLNGPLTGVPEADRLVFIEASGTLNPSSVRGFVEAFGEIHSGITYTVNGRFTTAFMLVNPDAATLEYLEEHCRGGYAYTPP